MSNQDKELTIEQQARDLLKQMGIEDWLSSGDSDQDQIQDLPARNLSPLMNLMEENKRLREEKVALISAKAVTINPSPMPEGEMIDYLRQTIDRQNQDIARLRDEGQKDYDGMREFQRKFIDASHEIERLGRLLQEPSQRRCRRCNAQGFRLTDGLCDGCYERVGEAMGYQGGIQK